MKRPVLRLVALAALLLPAVPLAASAQEAAVPAAAPAPAPAAEVSPAKAAKIRELFRLMGVEKSYQAMFDQMAKNFQAAGPGVSADFWEKFRQQMDIDELITQIIPIYAKYLSDEDLDGLIAFYHTPVGQKFISVQGPMMRDAMVVGQKWGAAKAAIAMQEIQKAKADAAKAAAPAPSGGG